MTGCCAAIALRSSDRAAGSVSGPCMNRQLRPMTSFSLKPAHRARQLWVKNMTFQNSKASLSNIFLCTRPVLAV